MSVLRSILAINLLLLSILLCDGVLGVTASRGDLTSKEKADVDNMIRDVMRASEVTGVGLALVRNGRVVYSQGYGTADLARRTRTTANTVFCQAEITETFTSSLLSSLLASSGYEWDTTVKTILGDEFYLSNPLVSNEVTLRDLMAHASGIANNEAALINAESGYTVMTGRAMFAPLVQPFRTSRVYSVVGMAIIQKVIERLGNGSWQELLEQRILQPLRMTSTFHVDAPSQTRLRFAVPVMKVGRNRRPVPWELISALQYVGTAGSVCSSPNDMGRWLLFHLEKGMNDQGQRIFPSEILAKLYDVVITMGSSGDIPPEALRQPNIPFTWRRDTAALGWVIGYYRQFRTVSRAGSWYGYKAMTSMIPDQGVGVSVSFVGRVGPNVEAAKALVNMYMLDILLRTNLWVNNVSEVIKNIASKILVPREDMPPFRNDYPSLRDRDLYEGEYGNGYNGRLWIEKDNETTNTLTLRYGKVGNYMLYPTRTKDRYFMRPVAADPLQFLTKPDVYRRLGTDTVMFEISGPKENDEHGSDAQDNQQDAPTDEAPNNGDETMHESHSNGEETTTEENDSNMELSVISIVVPTFNKEAPPVFLKDYNHGDAVEKMQRKAHLCGISSSSVEDMCSLAVSSTGSFYLVMVSLLVLVLRIA